MIVTVIIIICIICAAISISLSIYGFIKKNNSSSRPGPGPVPPGPPGPPGSPGPGPGPPGPPAPPGSPCPPTPPPPPPGKNQISNAKVIANVSRTGDENSGFQYMFYINHNSGNCFATLQDGNGNGNGNKNSGTSCVGNGFVAGNGMGGSAGCKSLGKNDCPASNFLLKDVDGGGFRIYYGAGGKPVDSGDANGDPTKYCGMVKNSGPYDPESWLYGHNIMSWLPMTQGVVAYELRHMPVSYVNDNKGDPTNIIWNALWLFGNGYMVQQCKDSGYQDTDCAQWPCFGEVDILEGLGDGFTPLGQAGGLAPDTNKVTLHSIECGDTVGGVGMDNKCQWEQTNKCNAVEAVDKLNNAGIKKIYSSNRFNEMAKGREGEGTLGIKFNNMVKKYNSSGVYLAAVQEDGVYVGLWLPGNTSIKTLMNTGPNTEASSSVNLPSGDMPVFSKDSNSFWGADIITFFPPEAIGQKSFADISSCNKAADQDKCKQLTNKCNEIMRDQTKVTGWQKLVPMITSTVPTWGIYQHNYSGEGASQINYPLKLKDFFPDGCESGGCDIQNKSELYWEFAKIKYWVSESNYLTLSSGTVKPAYTPQTPTNVYMEIYK